MIQPDGKNRAKMVGFNYLTFGVAVALRCFQTCTEVWTDPLKWWRGCMWECKCWGGTWMFVLHFTGRHPVVKTFLQSGSSINLKSLILSILIDQLIVGVLFKWPIRFCHSLFQPIMGLLSNFKSLLLFYFQQDCLIYNMPIPTLYHYWQ